ncbi:MAG: translation initiation factor IF-1 [Candidatus Parcubacteria bacterium]|nr:translation initiation factor IF-1 [Candidatus Parcubacteria bacterium]
MKNQNEELKVEGTIIEALPSTTFKVRLADGREILVYLAGKLRLHYIKILPGDRVLIELSPYDQNRGRIVYRLK